jgi:hypothetical protein
VPAGSEAPSRRHIEVVKVWPSLEVAVTLFRLTAGTTALDRRTACKQAAD